MRWEVAFWCHSTQMKLLYLWYQFLEGMALQRLVVYGNDQPEATQRADDISQLRGSGVVGLVHPMDGQKAFEAIPSAGNTGEFFEQALAFLSSWSISSVLAGFLGLASASTGGKGAYSLSQDQSDFYLKSRQGVAKEIAESISYDVIRPLVLLNFGTQAAFPQAKCGPLQDEQAQQLPDDVLRHVESGPRACTFHCQFLTSSPSGWREHPAARRGPGPRGARLHRIPAGRAARREPPAGDAAGGRCGARAVAGAGARGHRDSAAGGGEERRAAGPPAAVSRPAARGCGCPPPVRLSRRRTCRWPGEFRGRASDPPRVHRGVRGPRGDGPGRAAHGMDVP